MPTLICRAQGFGEHPELSVPTSPLLFARMVVASFAGPWIQ